MKSLLVTGSLVALLAALPVYAQSTGTASPSKAPPPLSQQDRSFLEQAIQGDLAEIDMGQLAMTRAESPAVREFGRWMVTDHSLSEDALRRFAERTATPIPTAPNAKQQAALQRLQTLNDAAFDRDYIPEQVQDHQATIVAFQQEVQSGENTMLKALTQHMVPMLEQHLAEAQDLAASPAIASSGTSPNTGVTPSGTSAPPKSGTHP